MSRCLGTLSIHPTEVDIIVELFDTHITWTEMITVCDLRNHLITVHYQEQGNTIENKIFCFNFYLIESLFKLVYKNSSSAFSGKPHLVDKYLYELLNVLHTLNSFLDDWPVALMMVS